MICDLSDFRWREPIKTDSMKREWSRKCAYQKYHGLTMEQYKSLHYLVKRLIRVGHVKQYVRTTGEQRKTTRDLASQVPTTSVAPKVVINYIHGGPVDEKYNSKRKKAKVALHGLPEETNQLHPTQFVRWGACPMDGTITFLPINANQVLQPHNDALILTLRINQFDVRRVLIDPGSAADLLQMSAYKQMGLLQSSLENPRWILFRFNGVTPTSLGDVVILVQAGSIT